MPELNQILRPQKSWVREVLDPDNNVEPIELRYNPAGFENDQGSVFCYRMYNQDGIVGRATLGYDIQCHEMSFCWIEVSNWKRRNLSRPGLASYLIAIEAAHGIDADFVSGDSLRKGSYARWNKMINAGVDAPCVQCEK